MTDQQSEESLASSSSKNAASMSSERAAVDAPRAPHAPQASAQAFDLSIRAKSASIGVELAPGDALASSVPTERGSGSDEPTEKRKPMKNVSRERMKEETKFLRARVQELERELSQTLAKKALERCLTPAPVWKDLAKRQASRREKSEQERDRLKAKLLHQLQVAKSLETIFRNRSGTFIEEVAAASAHKPFPVDDMEQLHERFMEEIDEAFPLVDIVLAESAESRQLLPNKSRRSSVVVQQADGDDKLYVELRENKFVPFPFERVCNATWRAITTEYSRQQRIIEEFCRTDDEYSSKFFLQSCAPGSTTPLTAAMVMRRFTQEHRTVLVWRSLNWDDTPLAKCEYGDETGWLIVERITDPVSGEPNDDGAIVRVCTRYVPIWEDQAKLLQAGVQHLDSIHDELLQPPGDREGFPLKPGVFTNRILNGTEEDIASMTEAVENILLDESIGSTEDDLESMVDELGAFANQQQRSLE